MQVDGCPELDVTGGRAVGVTSFGDVVGFEFRSCGNYLVGGYAAGDPFGPGQRRDVQFLPDDALSAALGLPNG